MAKDIGEREYDIYKKMLDLVKWGILAVMVSAGILGSGVLGV